MFITVRFQKNKFDIVIGLEIRILNDQISLQMSNLKKIFVMTFQHSNFYPHDYFDSHPHLFGSWLQNLFAKLKGDFMIVSRY